MAAGRPRDNHEEIRVKIKQAEREVLPAVQLEKKEIRMTVRLHEPAVPSIVMTTFENGKPSDADRIVGIGTGPQGVVSTLTKGVPPKQQELKPEMTRISSKQTKPSPNSGRKLKAEHAGKTAITEKTEDLMEFFEDQEKTQALPKRSASRSKPRTPSPSPVRQSIGLDHLDNLVRLMEQLRNLRDENLKLKNKCEYLESTKTLLQAKSSLEDEDVFVPYKSNSLPRPKKPKSQTSQKTTHSDSGPIRVRPRLPSAEDAMCIEFDYDSDQNSAKKPRMGGLYKRSYSTGSLEVPSDIMEQSGEDDFGAARLSESYSDKVHNGLQMPKSPESKRKAKFSKWAKVKKVLKSQQLSENISSGIKSIKEFGKGSYFRYASVSGRELAVPIAAESKSLDSGVGSGMDTETQESIRKSTSSGEPPSPTRFSERHIDVPTPNIDDCMGIWLGPPEWIEKEREKEQELLKQSVTTLSESPKSEPDIIPQSVSSLNEHLPLPRRQSSPMLVDGEDDRAEAVELHRTCSYNEEEELYHKSDKEKKLHKTPWGRMKHIMHSGSRKDSIKKKHRKGKDTEFPFEEVSEIDIEGYEAEIKKGHEEYLEGPVSRSTPKTSPVVYRQKHRDKSSSNSPPGKGKASSTKTPTSAGGNIDVSALLGSVTDDFNKKLQEWEEKKVKRSSGTFKESPEYSESVSYESAGAVSPEFLKKLEEWEKVKALKGLPMGEKKRDSQIEADADSSGGSDDEQQASPERHPQPISIEEIQKKLTDSFSRKMEEWERQKYRRQNSQTYEGREGSQKGYKLERQKTKKTKEEKEKEKMEKMREREIMRVEREEQKLEKERIRIEKERLKALEREAKIEKMKGRLSQPDMETKLKNPILSPLTEYKVTSDFARKLHEWEVMKGKDVSTAMYLEARKRSLQFAMEYQNASSMLRKNGEEEETDEADTESGMRKTSSESDEMFQMDESDRMSETGSKGKGQKPPPLTLMPCYDSPELSPGLLMSEDSSLDENMSATTESMTVANISSLEKANALLLDELQQKELEYNTLQEDVRDLNGRLVKFRDEHSKELNLYKQQLMEGEVPGPNVSTDSRHMSTTLTHLENKISELKKFGDQLAMSMEGAAVGKFQTVEGEESINIRLVDLLDKMRLVLQQASFAGANTVEDVSRKSSALHNFEKLYSQAMQLQVQMNNLRLSQLERNKEIMNMKRHLLLQEANNLLLQADITRREAELLHYKEYSRKGTPIKRWNTFSGQEDRQTVLPGREALEKESVFQRVQRLRSARIPISSTTDSDSEESSAKKPEPVKRRSPKQQRRSPKTARKSPSPRTKKKDSPKLIPHPPIKEVLPERSTERTEERLLGTSKQEVQEIKEGGVEQKMDFSTVVLPTAGVSLPKDISPHEMNGVPRRQREKSNTPPTATKVDHTKEKVKVKETDTTQMETTVSTRTEPKFPELLIPEWKKTERSHLIRMPAIEPDEVFETDDVFLDNQQTKTISEQLIMPNKVKLEERSKLLNTSFESNGSEDTLKYLSPDASPAPKGEPPIFPSVIKVVHRTPKVHGETASDPGQSRPSSLIRISVGHGTPLLTRKPPFAQQGQRPSARLNIPVIPLKRIKPAQELLEDSFKYRSGHSIYLTRILKRYPMKIECRSRSLDERKNAEKENVKEGFVRTMVKQLSREGTPDQKSSSSTPKFSPSVVRKADSPKAQSDFVQHIVGKLSKPCGPEQEKASMPLKDLTNEGQVKTLTQAFANGSAGSLPERTFTEAEKNYFLKVRESEGGVKSFDSSSSTSIAFSQLSTKTEPDTKTDSTMSKNINYSSMPMLNLEGDDIDQVRERSATTSGSSPHAQEYHYPLKSSLSEQSSPSQRHKVHIAVSMSPGRSRRILDPKLSPGRLRRIHEPKIEQVKEEPAESIPVAHSIEEIQTVETKSVPLRSPKAKRKEKTMDTIGVLCRQSMTFDLGVSGSEMSQSELGAGAEAGSQSSPIRLSASSTSSQSEAEISPGTSGTTKKKKTKHKFLDSSFIQKSRKFFKVSKETRCPSLECCGSDRELLVT